LAIEQITLSVPGVLPERPRASEDAVSDVARREKIARASEIEKAYLKAVQARDGYAFTDKTRKRNRERFHQALKALGRKVAADASRAVDDRSARLKIRTQIYADIMQLVSALSRDQLNIKMRARTRVQLSLAVGAAGLLGVVATLVLNDMLTWPLY
jgi:hypothetical protein